MQLSSINFANNFAVPRQYQEDAHACIRNAEELLVHMEINANLTARLWGLETSSPRKQEAKNDYDKYFRDSVRNALVLHTLIQMYRKQACSNI